MFSLNDSIVAETMKLSDSSSVFLLTRYETSLLAVSMLWESLLSMFDADVSNSFSEKVEDNNNEYTIINNIIFILITLNITNNITVEMNVTVTVRKRPVILFFVLYSLLLKKPIKLPTITTGCIFDGSSPKTTSIAIDNNRINISIYLYITFNY